MITALNHVGGGWQRSAGADFMDVHNPATAAAIGRVVLSSGDDLDAAVEAATAAAREWRNTPVEDRIQPLFRLKALMDERVDDLARIITEENGKTLAESVGELKRAIENVEVACGTPTLMQGDFLEDVAAGIDELMVRQPVGVCAIVCPFNFPAMIPFWFFPYAVACGNTCIVKPSERTPLTMRAVFELLDEAGFPPGVANLVNGDRGVVDAILEHPGIRAVSFVGSTPVARHVYATASAAGKRVQAQGGAKNPIVVLPDADIDATCTIAADSAFGCAGQRCLAASLAITVGDAADPFADAMGQIASTRVVGNGLDDGVEMGPVITQESRSRIEGLIGTASGEGARVVVDGRDRGVDGHPGGSFVGPTLLRGVPPAGTVAGTEIFGPVLGVMEVADVDEAISLVNGGRYGNMACLFTGSGAAARRFRHEADVGNIGINLGVAAPMAFFPFSGWRDSFFGTLHGQGKHAIEFFTQTKVVVERWPEGWSRRF
ncbi:MAG: CoA-acylating methylmalonate-semialdehyde dehydrogenase [Spirochaetaceae bacterium]|nr:CoA-acylating methylmalonate-semialdehyde dehydrogenase [Spirochaetaceae bacterium]